MKKVFIPMCLLLLLFSTQVFATTPERINWSNNQTPVKAQLDRSTCFDFAIVAAIEARYKRDYNLTLDLSEQYFHHLVKSTWLDTSKENFSPNYKYENQSSMWGGGGSGCLSVAKDYAICLETDINYNSTIGVNRGYLNSSEMQKLKKYINDKTNNSVGNLNWESDSSKNTVLQSEIDAFEYSPYYIPYEARKSAVTFGVEEFESISSPKVSSNIENILANGYDVVIDFNAKWKYNSNSLAYEYDDNSKGGAHVALIVGYDRPNRTFIVKNSWGGNSMTSVKYDVFEKTATGAAYVKKVRAPNSQTPKGKLLGTYNMDHDGWKGKLVIRRNSTSTTRLGHYIDSKGTYFSVNGYSTDAKGTGGNHDALPINGSNSGKGLKFSIDFSNPKSPYTNPSVMVGQFFYTDVYSRDAIHMAGCTYWGNTPYGIFLSRTETPGISGRFAGKSDWSGIWNINHDGWKGKLTINPNFTEVVDGVNDRWLLSGTYIASNGVSSNVKGYISKSQQHIANMTMYFPGGAQSFTLMYHTRENNIFSGYTYWNGSRFGVYGTKSN